MLFVDGENITLRAQETCKILRLELEHGPYWRRDTFFWFRCPARQKRLNPPWSLPLQDSALRATYYTSLVGDEDAVEGVRRDLWALGFSPVVFRKPKGRSSKGVDITMTKDMLTHAFSDHYDVAVLAAGDADYEPVVAEVRRLGKAVFLTAFKSGLSEKLRLACDAYYELDSDINIAPVKPTSTNG